MTDQPVHVYDTWSILECTFSPKRIPCSFYAAFMWHCIFNAMMAARSKLWCKHKPQTQSTEERRGRRNIRGDVRWRSPFHPSRTKRNCKYMQCFVKMKETAQTTLVIMQLNLSSTWKHFPCQRIKCADVIQLSQLRENSFFERKWIHLSYDIYIIIWVERHWKCILHSQLHCNTCNIYAWHWRSNIYTAEC